MKLNLLNFLITLEIAKTDTIIGIGSRIANNKFVGFFDLDNMAQEKAERIISILQKKHGLSDFLLFQSSEKNFHAVCLELKPLIDWVKIESFVNFQHAGLSLFKGEHVLRISSKFKNFIRFVKIVPSSNIKDLSKPHVDFFINQFKIPLSVENKKLIDGEINYHFYQQKRKVF